MLAALTADAVGARIHLASERRIRPDEIARVLREELGVKVSPRGPDADADADPAAGKEACSKRLGEQKLAKALERLFQLPCVGVYSEWGQPVHGVGNDVRILGLPRRRPDDLRRVPDAVPAQPLRARASAPRARHTDRPPRAPLLGPRIEEIQFGTGRPAAALPHAEFVRANGGAP